MVDLEKIRDLEHNHKGMQYDLWLLSTRQTGGVMNNAPIEPSVNHNTEDMLQEMTHHSHRRKSQ
jgi:hypothetical protein